MPTNDNEFAMHSFDQDPDPHGQAALLLVESLIHGLITRSVINTGDAIEIVQTAEHVQGEIADEADGAGAPMWRAHTLLAGIAASLRADGDGAAATTVESPI